MQKIHNSVKLQREKIILLLLYRSELHIHIRTTVNDVNNSIVK